MSALTRIWIVMLSTVALGLSACGGSSCPTGSTKCGSTCVNTASEPRNA